jgi:hypothetical protein
MDTPEKADKPESIRGRILSIVAGVAGVAGVVYVISQSCLFLLYITDDLVLINSGIATRGTVIAIKSDECSYGDNDTANSYDIRFTDNKGQTQVGNISLCDLNWTGALSVGDSVPVLYNPNDPMTIAIQTPLTTQLLIHLAAGAVWLTLGAGLVILALRYKRRSTRSGIPHSEFRYGDSQRDQASYLNRRLGKVPNTRGNRKHIL